MKNIYQNGIRLFTLILCLIFSHHISAQDRVEAVITVFDSADEPVIGASITDKNSNIGGITGLDGQCTLNVIPNSTQIGRAHV